MTMEQVTILNKMSEYDFSAPINVTMIFEDSDDDSKSFIDVSSCKNTDQVGLPELEPVTTNHEAQCLEVARDKNNIEKENKRSKRHISNNDEVNNNLQPNNCLSRGSKTRKFKDPEDDVYSVETVVDKCEKHTHAHQQKNMGKDTDCTQHIIQTINSEEPTYTCQQKNRCEEVGNVNSSLVTLSENLILIMDSYYQMQNQLRSIKDASIRKKSKSAFMYIQRYFLNLSYDLLNTLILPQENNTQFINSFLDNTVKMARRENGIKCECHHVYAFYKNMVQWAKMQKEHNINRLYRQNPISNTQNLIHANQQVSTQANTCLRQYLNKPPMQLRVPPQSNVLNANQCTDNSCIFSSGPPGRQIIIRRINPGDTVQTRNCNSMQKENEYYTNSTPVNRTPATNNNFESFVYNQPPKETVPANHFLPRSNYLSPNYHRPPESRRPPPPPYNMRQQNYYQNTNCLQPMTTQLPAPNRIDTTRSTESNESGYVSPSYSSPIMNQMEDFQTEEQTPFTPVISNIVSLNPRIPYTNAHGCHLCGIVTELWCPGCYTYYCSIFCEQLDSQFHKAVCRECSGWAKQNTK